jgi:uncharacterized membrane protein
MNVASLIIAILALALWVALLLTQPPSGWIHLPLAVGVILLVRWIALRKSVNGERRTVNGGLTRH